MNKRLSLLGGLIGLLLVLLLLSPADVKLGWKVKAVYLHGAITWVSFLIFALFALVSVAYLFTAREKYFNLAARGLRVGTLYWVVNFMIWVPLSWRLWNSIFAEPRAKASVWVMLLLGIGYVLSQIINRQRILALLFAILGMGIWLSYSGATRILHPFDPIGTSEGFAIKGFFLAILLTCTAIGAVLITPGKKHPV